MDQPSDIRDLSARRAGASVIELRSPSQLRPDLRDTIEPIQRKFGRPELVIREHTNNAVRWKQGERLNHLLEEACIRFSESDAVVTDDVTLSYRELDCRANQVARHLIDKAFSRATASACCSRSRPKPTSRCWR
jgi:non-ribosomal peptide synthetase component F